MNLRDLTHDQQTILAQVENGDFTLDDVSDHLELLDSERKQKIENYLHVINRLQGQLVNITNEIHRLRSIEHNKETSLKNIEAWLLMSMKDGEKHEFDLFKVSRVKGREVVRIEDDSLIPEDYTTFKQVRSVDKRAILTDLKGGAEVYGAELTTGKPSLRIK